MTALQDLRLRAPIPGESLDGYIAEMTAANELYRVQQISSVAGNAYAHRPTVATQQWDRLPALAKLLETEVEELRLRSHPLDPADSGRRAFFGTTVHRADLRSRIRHFAPSALRSSPHHRAMWQLRLPFDAGTGELLVTTCPKSWCGKTQRWRHSAGVRYCDVCASDLAAQDVPRLDEDLRADYELAVGLTDTDPARRDASLALLPAEIRELGPAMAYELLLRLIPMMEPVCTWRNGARIWANDPFDVARGIRTSWHALRSWPDAVLDKVTADLATSTTRFSDGNGGRTAGFMRLRRDGYVAKPVAEIIRKLHEGIDADGPDGERINGLTMGCQEAANLTNISTSLLAPLRRAGVLKTVATARGSRLVPVFDRAEIVAVDADIRRRWDLSRASLVTGLPYYALEQLCALGRIKRLRHPIFAARFREPQITEAAVTAFCDALRQAAWSRVGDSVPILSAVRIVGGRLKPWDAIVEAMLAGTLPFDIREVEGSLFERIRVNVVDLAGPASLPITRPGTPTALTIRMEMGFPFVDKMTKRDAGEVLNLGVRQYTRLLIGYRTSFDRNVPIDDAVRIAGGHITNTEIAARLGITYQAVRLKAAALGITRLSEAGYGRKLAERLLLPDEVDA